MSLHQRLAKWERRGLRRQTGPFVVTVNPCDDCLLHMDWPFYSQVWPLKAAARLPDPELKKRLDLGIHHWECARRRDLLKDQVDEAPEWRAFKRRWWGMWRSSIDFFVHYKLLLRE